MARRDEIEGKLKRLEELPACGMTREERLEANGIVCWFEDCPDMSEVDMERLTDLLDSDVDRMRVAFGIRYFNRLHEKELGEAEPT